MKLKDIILECPNCKVRFTPSDERAKKLMKKYRYINLCKECQKGSEYG